MNEIYQRFQKEAIRIARRYPAPDFYRDFPEAVGHSRRFFAEDTMVAELWQFVTETIENDYGHGLTHVYHVALDAGALAQIESASASGQQIDHRVRLAHAAGLLHDIKRKEKHHAQAGASYARQVLRHFPFTGADIEAICLAIGNHEAFGENRQGNTRASALLSDCLYDADKFRWGPENFTQTIWAMVSYLDVSPERFLRHYPRGMAYLKKIRDTFRTPTGQRYGPQIIDLGIAIGEELHEIICREFADQTQSS